MNDYSSIWTITCINGSDVITGYDIILNVAWHCSGRTIRIVLGSESGKSTTESSIFLNVVNIGSLWMTDEAYGWLMKLMDDWWSLWRTAEAYGWLMKHMDDWWSLWMTDEAYGSCIELTIFIVVALNNILTGLINTLAPLNYMRVPLNYINSDLGTNTLHVCVCTTGVGALIRGRN
jgi:hypothetical protein